MSQAELLGGTDLAREEHSRVASSLRRDLMAEVKAGWKQGRPIDVQGLLEQYPELRKDKSLVLDLAYEEYCLHEEAGEPPDLDAFCARFPTYKKSLRQLLDGHCYFESLMADEPWPAPVDTFAGCAILAELGCGAFARVYLAAEPALGNRRVVLKVSRQGAAEAETLGRLSHPHIVPVYSVREEPGSGLTVMCMPYLGSATLSDVLDQVFAEGSPPAHGRAILDAVRERTLPGEAIAGLRQPASVLRTGTYIDAVLHLGIQLAEALAHVHAMGVCHLDLKPSNVLMSPDGHPALLDFNLSFDKQAAGRQLGGTPAYMAPEQLRAMSRSGAGDPARVDARSDLFSLGVILHELLSGQHPFGPLPARLPAEEACGYFLARQQGGPLPIGQANPHVDRPLAQVIERCLASDPARRPQSALELATELRKSLSRPHRARRWISAHPWAVIGIVLFALLGVLAGVLFFSLRDPIGVREYKLGAAAYQSGRFPEAEEHFSVVLRDDLSNARALFWRGQARKEQHKFLAALEDLKESYTQQPDGRTKASLAYCLSLCSQPSHDEIIKHYQNAVTAHFETAEVCNNLGFSWYKVGEYEEARSWLDKAIALDKAVHAEPSLAAAYHNRALALHSLCLPHYPLSMTQKDQERLTLAVSDIETAISRGTQTAELYRDAARLYGICYRTGEGPRAGDRLKACMHQAIDLGVNPSNFDHNPILRGLLQELDPSYLHEEPANAAQPVAAIHVLDPVHGSPD